MRPQIVKYTTVLIIHFLVYGHSIAQQKEPPPPNPESTPPPPPGLDIDNGLFFLLMAGLLLGVVYLFKINTKKLKP